MIKHLIFFRGGNVWASDAKGEQIAEEQKPAWWTVIADKLARGVIDENTIITREHYSEMTLAELAQTLACSDLPIDPKTIFSTRERKGGEDLKEGKIEIGWKASEQLLPSETANFREALGNLVRKFQTAGAEITVATFVDGGAEPVNLVETTAASHAS